MDISSFFISTSQSNLGRFIKSDEIHESQYRSKQVRESFLAQVKGDQEKTDKSAPHIHHFEVIGFLPKYKQAGAAQQLCHLLAYPMITV